MNQVAYRVRVRGIVTGVGFRYSALHEAARYPGLQGYVRNADSQTVECVVQGEERAVSAMLAWLPHGPPSADVTECEATPVTVDPRLPPFRITR